jgi:hypothetical protein
MVVAVTTVGGTRSGGGGGVEAHAGEEWNGSNGLRGKWRRPLRSVGPQKIQAAIQCIYPIGVDFDLFSALLFFLGRERQREVNGMEWLLEWNVD